MSMRRDELSLHLQCKSRSSHRERSQTAAEHLDERQQRRELHIWTTSGCRRRERDLKNRWERGDAGRDDGGHVTLNVFMSSPPEEHQLSCISSHLSLELLDENIRTSRRLEVWPEPAEVDSTSLTSLFHLVKVTLFKLELISVPVEFSPQIIQRLESERRNRQTQMFLQVQLTSSFYL